MDPLDDPARVGEIRRTILGKPALKRLYEEFYGRYAACLARCPEGGAAIELGSGAGFAKAMIPTLIATDILPYEGIDEVVDATRMPYADCSLRLITMLNTFHHIPDVAAFLREAERCLIPGGRVLIVDQHPGWISSFIYRHLHHEPFDPKTAEWQFATTGPLSGANGALAWIVFIRDRVRFEKLFPSLEFLYYRPHTPFRYWLAGGLKSWCALPGFAWPLATLFDRSLGALSPQFGSFVDIEFVKK